MSDVLWTAIRDTREQSNNGWWFDRRTRGCAGTAVETLKTGDYTVKGLEDLLVIERKQTVAELAGNVFEARFENELSRMRSHKFAYVVCDFPFADVIDYPRVPCVPKHVRQKVRVSGGLLLKRLQEFEFNFPWVRWHFAGDRGQNLAAGLFKRTVEYAAAIGRSPTGPEGQ